MFWSLKSKFFRLQVIKADKVVLIVVDLQKVVKKLNKQITVQIYQVSGSYVQWTKFIARGGFYMIGGLSQIAS